MSRRLNIGVITKSEQAYYYGVLLDSIHKTLCRENCTMFVINTFMIYRFSTDKDVEALFFPLAQNHMDGWIVITNGASDDYIKELCKTGKPVVQISNGVEENGCCRINEDNQYGAEVVTQHLIDHGHKRILFVGWFEIFDMIERLEGYKKTLLQNGIDIDDKLIIEVTDPLYAEALKNVSRLINEERSFTAIFAANDHIAMGCVEALERAGLKVPEDVAVIGYDNSIRAINYNFRLTSMGQNVLEKGVVAVESILKMIRGEKLANKIINIKPELVLRASCGCKIETNNDIQLTSENFNSKVLVIDSLEKYHEKYFSLGTQLLTNDINEIKNLLPETVDNHSWKCMGFFEEDVNKKKEINLYKVIDFNMKSESDLDIKCAFEEFPPKEFLPDFEKLDSEEVVWIRPITSSSINLGVFAHISPINRASSEFAYDYNIILFNLLGNAMDRAVAISELKKALDTLEQTQDQLINSEKMTSLGGLVSGVAHEINTPIGVSVTAASYLNERSQDIMELFEKGIIKRSDFQNYLDTSFETIKILLINLKRASDLVNSFKQITVDNFVEEKRLFNVKQYIDEIMLSLNPKLRGTQIRIVINCPEDFEMYSHPGALSQIITNLVINSINHAYEKGDTGRIEIKIFLEDKTVNFIYSDDGIGIDEKIISKIFDPFFTTKRGRGGTGLGLNVVYNIVTQEYGGSIKCTSEPGMGAVFTIKFPLKEV